MADEKTPPPSETNSGEPNSNEINSGEPNSGKGGTATKTRRSPKKSPSKRPPQPLPPYKVLLHNDDKNELMFVVDTIVALTPLNEQDAELRTKEAHKSGVALLLVTHKERAELYQEQFQSKGLTVTIEPAEA